MNRKSFTPPLFYGVLISFLVFGIWGALPAHAAVSVAQTCINDAFGTSVSCAFGSNITNGDVLVTDIITGSGIVAAAPHGCVTWNFVASSSPASLESLYIGTATSTKSCTVTMTGSGGSNIAAMQNWDLQGALATVDGTPGFLSDSSYAATIHTATTTPSSNGDIILTDVYSSGSNTTSTLIIAAPFTTSKKFQSVNFGTTVYETSYDNQSTAAAISGQYSSAGSNLQMSIMAIEPGTPIVNSFIASPSVIPIGSSLALSWNVTNASSVTVSGNNLNVSTSTALGTISVTPNATGTLIYTLAANNTFGTSTVTTSVTVAAPPQVSWITPSSNATVSSTITLTASSTDTISVSSTAFYYGSFGSTLASSTFIGSTSTASGTLYSRSWNTSSAANGSTTLWALATNSSNVTSSVSTTVNVENPPIISAVFPSSYVGTSTAIITWTTNESASSQVNYGLTSSYGSSATSSSLVTSHSITLAGLTSGTTYHYQVLSTDAVGNTATSTDSTFTMITPRNPSYNIGPVDVYVDLSQGTPGTTITPAILASGTIGLSALNATTPWTTDGTSTGMTLGLHQIGLPGSITVGSTTYTPNHGSQALVDSNAHSGQAEIMNFPSGNSLTAISIAGFVTFGSLGGFNTFDLLRVDELAGHYVILQLHTAGGTPNVDIETDPGGVATTTTPVAITPGTYWYSMNANYGTGIARLNLYETTNYTLVDSFTLAQATGSDITLAYFGNEETGTSTASTSFENTLVDYTHAAFPLGPGNPPRTAWTVPSANATVSSTITLTASSTADPGIASIAFYYGLFGTSFASSTLIGSTSTASGTLYSLPWNTTVAANGSTTLWALATDTLNNTSTASTTVNVQNPAILQVTTSITGPADGATVSGATTISATATSTVGITSVQFYLDGTPFGSAVTSIPYTSSWDTTASSNGSHTLSSLATDSNNNTATSSVITVTVSNAASSPPPAGGSVGVAAGYNVGYPPGYVFNPTSTTGTVSSTPAAATSSLSSLQAMIASLQNQLKALLAKAQFARNLQLHDQGSDVEALQQFFITQNAGPAAQMLGRHGTTRYFGLLTYNALKEYQKSVGLPGTGYFGPLTRAFISARELQ